MTAAVDDLVVAFAADGLPGSLHSLPEQELPEHKAHHLVDVVQRHQLTGIAVGSAEVGTLVLPETARDALVDAHRREMTTCLRLEHDLLGVTALLDEAGHESVVLGGSASARLDYPDPALRTFSGLDLLLRPADLRGAIEMLLRNGWRAVPDDGNPPVALLAPSGLPLRLHTTLEAALIAVPVDSGGLWADAQEFSLGGRRLAALGTEKRILQACCRVARSDTAPLVAHRDLAEMVLFGTWHFARLIHLAAAWKVQGFLAEAIRASWERLAIADVTGLSVWAEAYRPVPHPGAARLPGLAVGLGSRRSLRGVRDRLGRHP